MTVPQVSNGIFIPVALPAPVSWTVRMRPYAKAITAAAPWAGTRIFPTMGTGDPAERRVAAEEVEHDHREPLGDTSHSRLYPNETLWHALRLETLPMAGWHLLGTPLAPKTLDRLFLRLSKRIHFISY